MKVRIKKSEIKGKVEAPPSKSLTHRALIISSIIPGTSTISNPLICEDTKATIEACRKIGAKIEVSDPITVNGVDGVKTAGNIDVGNSGTTLRLMAGVCSLADGKTTITGDSSVQKRPMIPLLEALEKIGAKRVTIGGNSSQFVSSLLIAGLKTGVEIELTSELKSKPYLDLTIDVIQKAGGVVDVKDNVLKVPPGQKLKPLNISIEPDWSSASFLLAAGALAGEVEVGINQDSLQGDRKIIDILRDMGAEVEVGETVTVRKVDLSGIEVELSDTPDLLPIVSVLMALAKGKSRIMNTEHAREKESDRIHVMAQELNRIGGKAKEKPDGLEIEGVETLNGTVDPHGDHRVAMALIIAGLSGSVEVEGAECTDISFPGFLNTLRSLGVEVRLSKTQSTTKRRSKAPSTNNKLSDKLEVNDERR